MRKWRGDFSLALHERVCNTRDEVCASRLGVKLASFSSVISRTRAASFASIDATREGKSSVLSSSCFTLDSRNYSRARAAITEGLSMIQRRLIFTSDSWRKPNCTNDYEPVDRTECLIKSCVSWIVKIRGGGTWRGTWNLSRCLFEGTRSLRIRSTLFLFPRDEMRRGSRIGWPWKRRNSILRARNLISRSSLFFRARTKTIKRFLLRILFHSSCVCVCVCVYYPRETLARFLIERLDNARWKNNG